MEMEIIAFMASTLGVGGALPQIIKIIRTGETKALSYAYYMMGVVAGVLWVSYGLMVPTYSIVFWNTISTVMAIAVLMLKFRNERLAKVPID